MSARLLLAQPALLGTAAGALGRPSPHLRRTHGLFPWCSLVQIWYLPLPTLGVEFINILSLLHFSAFLAFLLLCCLASLQST